MRVREHEVQEMNIVPTPSHPHPSPLPEGEGIYSEVARSTKPTSPSGVQTGDIAYTRSGTSLTRVRGHRLHPFGDIAYTLFLHRTLKLTSLLPLGIVFSSAI